MSASIWSPLENAIDYVKKVVLAAFDGASLVGYYELQGEVYFRTLLAKLRDRWASVKGYGAVGDGITDDTLAIQRAITANYGKMLSLPPGDYKISISLKILAALELDFSGGRAKLLLATQNMNGIEIGDGTDVTRNALFGTRIYSPNFAPFSGVTKFTSGTCILRNYVAYVDIFRPSFYGKDAGVRKLFNGLRDIRATECDTPYILAQEMGGDCVYSEGLAGVANRTVDCNYDFARIINSDAKGLYWGSDTAGLGAYKPIFYGMGADLIEVNATSGPNGQNYFITDIDGEADNGGVTVTSGQRVLVRGGWLGGLAHNDVINFTSASDSCECDVTIVNGRVILAGGSCRVSGGEISGDNSTAGSGITISGNDCTVADSVLIRQFPTSGIAFVGTPSNVKIGAVSYKNNGQDITFGTAYAALAAPVITASNTDKTRAFTAATTLAVSRTVNFIQVTGATTITTIPPQGVGSTLTIQAGAGGITLATGGNLLFAGSPLAIPAFNTITFVCDGATWFSAGKSF